MNTEEFENIKQGDLLHYSWGYDMTHNEFAQVISKGKTILARIVGATAKETGYLCGQETPIKDGFIEELPEFRIRISRCKNGNISLSSKRPEREGRDAYLNCNWWVAEWGESHYYNYCD